MPMIRPFKPEDLLNITMRDSDQPDFAGVNLQAHGQYFSAMSDEAVTVLQDGEILFCSGGVRLGKTCGVYLVVSSAGERYPLLLVKVLKKLISNGRARGMVRFETLMNMQNERALRFIEFLGFEREGVCRATGENLLDRYLYAFIAPAEEA
ncbi:hypothetical protein [Halodesulfovibrio spirochaetisodalis]|uniref:N-acetyltransferase domain-containing protein n=1 Tax=Halodesulfovibrio spirochaetisodalis TaxID=1560234 RepID=A0A1B7X9Z1_9BACT|nr:hypothetical protein [Halodesulfovibrio spirochaetisodalis]OBQ46209.1 hypothetical protein SP90_13490 [Halodesulfovibrio spirochaetisodalis]